jgi:hypothetical protein
MLEPWTNFLKYRLKILVARTEFYARYHALRMRHSIADHRLGRILCISPRIRRQRGPRQQDNAQNQYEIQQSAPFQHGAAQKEKAGCKIRPLEFHS